MKLSKILGLAAVSLIVLMAVAATASATTLTSPSGTTYTSTIKAEASSTVSMTSAFGGFGTISCKKSTIEMKVEQHGAGKTALGNISALTFGECSNPVTVIVRGVEEWHYVNSSLITVTLRNTTIETHETLTGTCLWKAPSTGVHAGEITLGATPKTHLDVTLDSEGGFCGPALFEAEYKIVTPTTLFADA